MVAVQRLYTTVKAITVGHASDKAKVTAPAWKFLPIVIHHEIKEASIVLAPWVAGVIVVGATAWLVTLRK